MKQALKTGFYIFAGYGWISIGNRAWDKLAPLDIVLAVLVVLACIFSAVYTAFTPFRK